MNGHTFFPETLPASTHELASLLSNSPTDILKGFYLSGGTALSLQLGHRESEDLDFFSETSFNPLLLQTKLQKVGTLNQTELDQGTLNTYINGVKLQFLEYPYPLLKPSSTWNHISISSILDIACTKLQTISMRGSKKDFIDLYFLLDTYSLKDLFLQMKQKYQNINYNLPHILKSLVYFKDAENQPTPRMHQSVEWETVKQTISTHVKSFSLT